MKLANGAMKDGDMEISEEGAFLTFDKWREEDRYILCISSLFGWSLTFRGKVAKATREEISISAGEVGGIVLRLSTPDLGFTYMEARELPPEVKASLPPLMREKSALGVALPLRFFPSELEADELRVPRREKLLFFEEAT
jgi:hypothetical protein